MFDISLWLKIQTLGQSVALKENGSNFFLILCLVTTVFRSILEMEHLNDSWKWYALNNSDKMIRQ